MDIDDVPVGLLKELLELVQLDVDATEMSMRLQLELQECQ